MAELNSKKNEEEEIGSGKEPKNPEILHMRKIITNRERMKLFVFALMRGESINNNNVNIKLFSKRLVNLFFYSKYNFKERATIMRKN